MTDKKNNDIDFEIVGADNAPAEGDAVAVGMPLEEIEAAESPLAVSSQEGSEASESSELSEKSEGAESPKAAESSESPEKAEPAEPAGKAEPAESPEHASAPIHQGIRLEKEAAELAREDEKEGSFNLSLKRVLVGEMLSSKLLRDNVWLMLIIVVFVVISITNRYSVQQQLLEQSKLKKELQDTKFKALSASSDLTERTRKSRIIETLQIHKDSTLKDPPHPAFLIEVPSK